MSQQNFYNKNLIVFHLFKFDYYFVVMYLYCVCRWQKQG